MGRFPQPRWDLSSTVATTLHCGDEGKATKQRRDFIARRELFHLSLFFFFFFLFFSLLASGNVRGVRGSADIGVDLWARAPKSSPGRSEQAKAQGLGFVIHDSSHEFRSVEQCQLKQSTLVITHLPSSRHSTFQCGAKNGIHTWSDPLITVLSEASPPGPSPPPFRSS